MFAMTQYEVKYIGKDVWEKISEVEVLGRLCETFDRVTPAVQEMIHGKTVLTSNAAYRIEGKEG
jgi:hypothetical protein